MPRRLKKEIGKWSLYKYNNIYKFFLRLIIMTSPYDICNNDRTFYLPVQGLFKTEKGVFSGKVVQCLEIVKLIEKKSTSFRM